MNTIFFVIKKVIAGLVMFGKACNSLDKAMDNGVKGKREFDGSHFYQEPIKRIDYHSVIWGKKK